MKIINRVGQRYTRLTVIERAPNKSEKDTNARWLCQCDCGNTCIAYGQDLQREKFKSCGCLNADRIKTHGRSRTRVYGVWRQIVQRCRNPDSPSYHNYGARGIDVCERWRSFENFIADMGDRPAGYSLDRIDNDKGYFPENCRWTTMSQQLNNRRNNVVIEWQGKSQTLAEWATELGFEWHTLRNRLQRLHWSVEKAFTTPITK